MNSLGCSVIFLSAPFFCFFFNLVLLMPSNAITNHCFKWLLLNYQDNLHWLTVLHQGQLWQPSEPASVSPNPKFLGERISLLQETLGSNSGLENCSLWGGECHASVVISGEKHLFSSSKNRAVSWQLALWSIRSTYPFTLPPKHLPGSQSCKEGPDLRSSRKQDLSNGLQSLFIL